MSESMLEHKYMSIREDLFNLKERYLLRPGVDECRLHGSFRQFLKEHGTLMVDLGRQTWATSWWQSKALTMPTQSYRAVVRTEEVVTSLPKELKHQAVSVRQAVGGCLRGHNLLYLFVDNHRYMDKQDIDALYDEVSPMTNMRMIILL